MTIEGVKSLSDAESVSVMKKYVDELLQRNIYTKQNPNWNGNAFLSYKNYLVTVGKAVANTNGLELGAIQAALKAMNPGPIGTGKIWNPATIFGPPPGAIGLFTDNADVPVASMNPRSQIAAAEDAKKKPERERNVKEIDNLNMYTADAKFNEKYYLATQTVEPVPGVRYNVPDYSRLFERKTVGPDFGDGQKGFGYYVPVKSSRINASDEIIQQRRAIENDDAFFTSRELEDGYIDINNAELPDNLTDDGNYMPFFLEDLRSNGKRIYFRAFFKNLRESISPEWSQERYFGRVEPVGVYQGASRTVSLSFAVVAMSPAGFTAMWRKLNALSKMLYPTYRNGVMVRAPVCKLRIGDLICDEAGTGLTGYIASAIELDYSDSPWEISKWTGYSNINELGKAPMMAVVSFTYQIIHERAPQIDDDYNFDTTIFRRIGGAPNVGNFNADEEDAGVTPVTGEGEI